MPLKKKQVCQTTYTYTGITGRACIEGNKDVSEESLASRSRVGWVGSGSSWTVYSIVQNHGTGSALSFRGTSDQKTPSDFFQFFTHLLNVLFIYFYSLKKNLSDYRGNLG
jgi:hypothetical protein